MARFRTALDSFYVYPAKTGQTLGDMEKAEIRSVEEVERLHTQAKKPAVIGNCMAGRALALLNK